MEFTKYNIQKEDTIESIATKHKISVNELLDFHNANSTLTQQFFGSTIPIHINELIVPLEKDEKYNAVVNYLFEAKYRCEQTIVTKLNGIPTNTAKTKREFLVKKQTEDENIFFTISITDQIIETNPNQYQEAIELVSELDWVKCDGIVLKVNSLTGNIEKIVNHEEIINKWCEHKKKLENKYAFIRNPKGSDGIKKFIQTAEQQIVNEKTLLEDLETKMFFDIFFK